MSDEPKIVEINDEEVEEVVEDGQVKKKKKKRKKKKKTTENDETLKSEKELEEERTAAELKKKMDQDRMLQLLAAMSAQAKSAAPNPNAKPTTLEAAREKEFKFWKTQPVVQIDEKVVGCGKIEPDRDNVPEEPMKVPEGFEWCTVDVNNSQELEDLHQLLNMNYVEDEDAMFRLKYSSEFLLWALTPPGWKRKWHLALRVKTTKKLVAFISAIPATLGVDHVEREPVVEINFLCVKRKIREKRVAAVMIKEITRRVHVEGLFVAAYTAGHYLPTPYSTARYWHRSIEIKKLVDIRFSYVPHNTTMADLIKKFKLPTETVTPGLRLMEEKDCEDAMKLLENYLSKNTRVHPVYDLEEFKHWFLHRDDVITCYVVEDPETKELTDLLSFYTLNSSIIRHPDYTDLKAAYCYYNIATKTDFKQLMNDLLIIAARTGFDVVNALDVMENSSVLEDLHYGKGDGCLHYYFYNYKVPPLTPNETGFVLL